MSSVLQPISQRFLATLPVIALMTATLPAQAAQLQFDFTTIKGGVGSFIFDTDTPTSGDSPLFVGSVFSGPNYIGAISNFVFSSTDTREFTSTGGDFAVFPTFLPSMSKPSSPLALFGVPAGCSISDISVCVFQIALLYGNGSEVADLPDLSANPTAYDLREFDRFNPITGELISAEGIASQSVTAVPEPSSMLGLLTASTFALGMWRKRSVAKDLRAK